MALKHSLPMVYKLILILVACKTDTNGSSAHKGISLLLVDSNTPGFSKGRQLEKVGHHS